MAPMKLRTRWARFTKRVFLAKSWRTSTWMHAVAFSRVQQSLLRQMLFLFPVRTAMTMAADWLAYKWMARSSAVFPRRVVASNSIQAHWLNGDGANTPYPVI